MAIAAITEISSRPAARIRLTNDDDAQRDEMEPDRFSEYLDQVEEA